MVLVDNVTGMGYVPGPELGRYSYGFRGSPMPVCLRYNLKIVSIAFFLWGIEISLCVCNRFLAHGLVEH